MSYANVGKVWTTESFDEYLNKIAAPLWANKICLHHTAAPSLAQRPKGLTIQHIINIRDYYKNNLGWNRGPHLFIDEDQIFGMTPLAVKGIHAASFNSNAIGIEVLGDYDSENPLSGRGNECWETAAKTVNALAKWLDIPINTTTLLFHRDDPKTSKTCPGTKVKKDWFIKLCQESVGNPVQEPEVDILESIAVVPYLVDVKKWKWADASAALKRVGNVYTLNGKELDYAYYNTKAQTTFAPKREIDEAIS